MRPRQMRPMWQSVYSHSRESDVMRFFFFFFAPLCLTAAHFFLLLIQWWILVRGTDDGQMLTHLMPATHPLPCAPHLPLKAVTPASYTLHKLLLKKRLLKHLSVDRMEWKEPHLAAWLPLHCSAIQAACPCFRFKWASWTPPSHTHTFLFSEHS